MTSFASLALCLLFSVVVRANVEIVGGQQASAGQFPYQVAWIRTSFGTDYYDGQFCGGSLIASNWVLTAGHCFRDLSSGTSNVDTNITQAAAFIGENSLAYPSNGETISISAIYVHPTYTYTQPEVSQVDLCLVQLSRASIYGTAVYIATTQNDLDGIETAGYNAIVAGWGSLSEDSNPADGAVYPDSLYWVTMPLVSLTTCQSYAPFTISDNYLCAGSAGHDSCQGDSGGALVVKSTSGKIQVGVVSSGTATSQPLCPGIYGIYTRVAPFRSWMESVAGTLPNATFVYDGASPASTPQVSALLCVFTFFLCSMFL